MKRALGLALLLGLASPAAASRDIRVVLDLSRSMASNDRGRLAILSTILLYDLAKPNPTTGDSFVVIPFDHDWTWPSAAAAPPVSTRPRVEAQFGKRDDFVQAVSGLPYDANATYFYPGIAAAVQDLEQKAAGPTDVRTIVLITDGVPLPLTRSVELQRIRDDLGPRLERHGIRLYVLAFGGEADQNRAFFADMVRTPSGDSLGDFFVDPNGSRLLTFMLEIFSRSFGFSPDTTHTLPGTSTLDLDASTKPEKVAVVVLAGGGQAPSLRLTTPVQHNVVSAPEGTQSATTVGGGYSLVWLLAPSPGDYGLDSNTAAATVAVLRPIHVTFEIRPSPQHKQVDRALAGTAFPLRILVRSAIGSGDPGPIALSFRTCGDLIPQPAGAAPVYKWKSEPLGPAAGAFTVTPEGRIYDVSPEFRQDPETPASPYVGYIELTAQMREAVVGMGTHRVEVHPLLALSPFPLVAYVSDKALGRRERACTEFMFHLDAGQLPHPDRPSYSLRAALIAPDPKVFERELNHTTFTLDGLPLEIDGKPGPDPGAWYKGRPLAPAAVLGKHELCARIGKPVGGDPSKPIELKLAATLLEDPYDDFGVVQPFQLKIPIAPPTFFERWRMELVTGLTLLGFAALIWFLRDRPAFPSDLCYAVGREDSGMALATRAFPEPSSSASLLGWIAEGAVVAPGEKRALGRIRPVDAELFQLRPARGVQVESLERNETIPRKHGLSTLAVHRTYRLRTERASYLFRMEYQ